MQNRLVSAGVPWRFNVIAASGKMRQMDPWLIAFVLAVVFVAATAQTVTGFGFALVLSPALFAAMPMTGVPTVELTVHWRGRPAGAWHYGEFRTNNLTRGYLEEDGLLWGEDGALVAQSRQLALYLTTPPG